MADVGWNGLCHEYTVHSEQTMTNTKTRLVEAEIHVSEAWRRLEKVRLGPKCRKPSLPIWRSWTSFFRPCETTGDFGRGFIWLFLKFWRENLGLCTCPQILSFFPFLFSFSFFWQTGPELMVALFPPFDCGGITGIVFQTEHEIRHQKGGTHNNLCLYCLYFKIYFACLLTTDYSISETLPFTVYIVSVPCRFHFFSTPWFTFIFVIKRRCEGWGG